MKLPATAHVFNVENNQDLDLFFKNNKQDVKEFILGGGSNIILSPNIKNRPVLKIEIKGIKIIKDEVDYVLVNVGAGEVWDDFVKWAVENNYSGVEALSAIPGTVGAGPVQNIGAYGIEIKDVFDSLEAYDTKNNSFVVLQNNDCNFSYRNSIFKSSLKGRYIIVNVNLKLLKNKPIIPDYKGVQEYFNKINIVNPTLLQIRDAIIDIRWSKLPKPEVLPNCGSFFENPIVEKNIAETLKNNYPDMPIYPYGENMQKISAGYLIDQSGLKGITLGPIGTYSKNALVLINHGGGTYTDVVNAKNHIIKTVYDKFGIVLKSEPEFVD